MADQTRALVLRRDERGMLCLHDAETGAPLAAQLSVAVTQLPNDLTRVTVEFCASEGVDRAVKIEVNDG